jgi:nucleotide-binding universal stress UspA family protein
MPCTTLMVSVVAGRSNKELLRTVGDLATKFHSGVIGVAACRLIQAAYSGYSLPAKLFEEDRKQIDRELRTAEMEFRGAFGDRSTRLEWRTCTTVPSLSDHLAREARGADVIVVGVDGDSSAPDATRQVNVSSLVMQAGRPVLIVPKTAAGTTFDRILVCWKETREAQRAVSDALPFLLQAKQVTIAAVTAKSELIEARNQVVDVVGWLGQHGVRAQTLVRASQGTHADELNAVADQLKAGLVVAGAYGYFREREWVLGGVTSDLLQSARRCSLLSH